MRRYSAILIFWHNVNRTLGRSDPAIPFESNPVAVIAGNLEYRMNPRMSGFRLGRR